MFPLRRKKMYGFRLRKVLQRDILTLYVLFLAATLHTAAVFQNRSRQSPRVENKQPEVRLRGAKHPARTPYKWRNTDEHRLEQPAGRF